MGTPRRDKVGFIILYKLTLLFFSLVFKKMAKYKSIVYGHTFITRHVYVQTKDATDFYWKKSFILSIWILLYLLIYVFIIFIKEQDFKKMWREYLTVLPSFRSPIRLNGLMYKNVELFARTYLFIYGVIVIAYFY